MMSYRRIVDPELLNHQLLSPEIPQQIRSSRITTNADSVHTGNLNNYVSILKQEYKRNKCNSFTLSEGKIEQLILDPTLRFDILHTDREQEELCETRC